VAIHCPDMFMAWLQAVRVDRSRLTVMGDVTLEIGCNGVVVEINCLLILVDCAFQPCILTARHLVLVRRQREWLIGLRDPVS